MTDWIDVSVPLRTGLTSWPGSVGVRLSRTASIDRGDAVNNSRLDCDVHAGTHVDAPLHHLADGADVLELPLEALIGPVEVAHLSAAGRIGAGELETLALPSGTSRLLLRTRNSEGWVSPTAPFRTDFAALTAPAATWLVELGIRLIGVDYLSVQRYEDGPECHRILLSAGVVILEGLNLSSVRSGSYDLICLPIALSGSDGAPARAVLRPR